MASGKKRVLDDASTHPKAKRPKTTGQPKKSAEKIDNPSSSASILLTEEVDFPRGGGTSLTPLEVKAIRAEAVKEANEKIFKEKPEYRGKRRDRKVVSEKESKRTRSETLRIEHLNYKRITVGMKLLGQIVSVQPLALIISLPNQLFGHVPITEVSSQLTSLLESLEEDADEELSEDGEEGSSKPRVPELSQIFHPGQYVRTIVSMIHPAGTTNTRGLGRDHDQVQKASRRVELSLVPEKVNAGVLKTDLRPGFALTAAIKSVEDHGYILNLGIPDVSGFLSFKEAKKEPFEGDVLEVGRVVNACITKVSGNGRTYSLSVDPAAFRDASLSEVSSVTSILPGTLVQSLVIAVLPDGLNLQVLGYFGGTVDRYQMPLGDVEQNYKVGKKLKARVLYDVGLSSPPRFALSLAPHVIKFDVRRVSEDKQGEELQVAFPIGTILEAVKVIRVESERGLVVEVSPGVMGFVHISQTSDDHVPSLSPSSGLWKIGTVHKGRVTGYFPFDGYLQLSLRQSVLEQKFLQVGEVQVGELVRGTVKRLTDSALFVSISGSVDAVIWPNHYADIVLKHPQKRFMAGSNIKCRVLVVNPERKRIVLTAKKTLLESKLPIISKPEDAVVDLVTHAVVFKVTDKGLNVEFYNNVMAFVPAREASETALKSLSEAFPIGKAVQVKVISVDPESKRIFASIRQASPTFKKNVSNINGVEIGDSVEGVIAEIHKEQALVTLQPTQVRALLSLINLANRRGLPLAQLRASLKVGEELEDLVVVSRNPEKGFVLVATKPKEKQLLPQNPDLRLNTVEVGQVLVGRVVRHVRRGALVKFTNSISGTIHPTDTCDDYESGSFLPPVDSTLKVVVIAVDKAKGQLTLSTRPSRLNQDEDRVVVDREISNLHDIKVGDTVRGFIKSVAEHGLFVTLGRDIDARVQIRELFDEYVKDWKSHFAVDQLVKGRITHIDHNKKQVELSFRSSDSRKGGQSGFVIGDFSEGQKVDGRVKKIEEYGLFIEIKGSKVSGLCHKSELSDNPDADVTLALHSFRIDDQVKAVILSIDQEKRRLSFGLKPSYFAEEDFRSGAESEDYTDDDSKRLGAIDDGEVDDEDIMAAQEDASDEDSEQVMDENMGLDIDLENGSLLQQSVAQVNAAIEDRFTAFLNLKEGFQWSAEQRHEEDIEMTSSSDEEEDKGQKKKKRKRKEIEQDFTADMHSKVPESNADFERVLLGSPNSSYLWVQYMSFQLQISEVDKAREIARRALRTINFREEQEKLNIWIALLNLENVYGTEETLEATFKEAARYNDSKTVHLRLAAILDQSGRDEQAEEQYKRTCKKFGQSSKVWTLFGEHYLKRGKPEEARKLLPRSLQSLERRKHLKTISKFAQLEYKFGDPERGKTVFEGIVDSHPKRWDLWSVYIDMEVLQGDIMSLRNICNRVLALKMTSHKAKSFFKKWLEIERRIGDEQGAEIVKAKAIEWTQRAAGSS
ncbi:U3 snoRNP-associated protein Rrp5 [Laetiporus sulphureus 93-53]|uniref:U3 snoRNP-associated protein Rrp5 n=1 Tax=Laetiporus sulphureus 93-53 TaxID=1314785 RepID=A0A165DXE7_9APHY|nr:U3 snoRNP-associated protein Rrp5 [Laetiporus sulphureus 93-53]KZT05820.1 U3 snoRNP-associated protein Rrp5 [Laetiporus sulphureus 93-53]